MRTRTIRSTIVHTTLALAVSLAATAHAWTTPDDGGGASSREMAALHREVGPYFRVDHAIAAGYAPSGGCVAGPAGGQGIHFAHAELMAAPVVSADRPQLLMYEPRADGSVRFLGVAYRVIQRAWHASGHALRPTLFGHEFALDESALEPYYHLRVWSARHNPDGVFATWNALVTCDHATARADGAAGRGGAGPGGVVGDAAGWGDELP